MYYEVGVSDTVPRQQGEGADLFCGVAAEGTDGDHSMSLPRKVWPEQDKVQSSRCRPARVYQPMSEKQRKGQHLTQKGIGQDWVEMMNAANRGPK
jgi:hypothetical protein